MGLFRHKERTRPRSRDAPEKRDIRKAFEDFIKGVDLDGGAVSFSGASVDEQSAMRTSAVYACVKILAETVASLPLHLFRNGKDGRKEQATKHPLYACLYETPNPESTSFNFREQMMTSLLLWGNAYARIVRDGRGHVAELWYLKPNAMTIRRTDEGFLEYDYLTDKGATVTYKPEDIFHVKGLSFDGVKGLSPIGQAREAIGLALSTEEYGAKFFGNGARPGGIIEFPGTMKDPDKVRESWNKTFQGAANSHRVAVLEQGAKFQTVGLPPEESQFLETRKFQINEICRIFRVPPHLVGDLEKATFSNIEHQSIEFVQHTVRPWLVRWEQEIGRSLLDDGERGLYFAKFNVDGLLRGDYAARMRGYSIGIQNGFLSPNCVRALEDLDPIPDEKGGNNFFVNGNMKLLNDTETKPATGNSQTGGEIIGKQKGNPDAPGDGAKDG